MAESTTYSIKNVEGLIDSAGNLANYKQSLVYDSNSLSFIKNSIESNWLNNSPNANDLKSILSELQGCIDDLNNSIIPVTGEFSDTMMTLALSQQAIERQSISREYDRTHREVM